MPGEVQAAGVAPSAFLELVGSGSMAPAECVVEWESARANAGRHERRDAGLDEPVARLAGKLSDDPADTVCCGQTARDRRYPPDHAANAVLVAVDAVDGRKGIDSLAALCRQKLQADPFSGWLFCVPHPQRPGDQDFVL